MKKLLFLAALTLCAAPAYAAPDRFGQMDKDGNGQVDWEEFQAAVPGMKRPAFDTIDADKSGGISRGEWDSFMKSHMGGQKGMPPPGWVCLRAWAAKPCLPPEPERAACP